MADYNISAQITADASGFESGVKKAQKATKNLSKSISGVIQGLGKNGLVGALGAVGLASTGLTATLGTVVKIAHKVSQTMAECTNAYKTQLIAERQLTTAIQNNPYVTGSSEKALKQFASEMQKVSNYGDEQLIPMMANLVSLGRTEDETMKIMSVALDMSASGAMSLDTAINQLNATLNGNVGRLGQQNAELKGLTEEELKNGKAVEILGEKYKGLAQATQDTSKQLANVKGDFKEVLGQFTLPSSDMWNKFWTGFYERGIEVIGKINAYIDTQTIGKKLAGAITDQLKAFGTGDIGGRIDYIRNALKVVTDDELIALQNYLQGLSKISDNQKQILNRIQAELDARKQITINQKTQADASAKQKQEEDERLAKEKELAEIKEKQAKVLEEWEKKLFAIRLENLEEIRDAELDNEELTQEERLKIFDFYGEQILAMKLQQIEKEREEALNGENVSEEARAKINLYYEDKITQVKKEETKKRLKIKKDEKKEEEKEEKQSLEVIVKLVQESTKKIGDAFKKVASNIKNIFSKIGNIFTKVIQFNPDEALDNLLKFEDSVLTFFVETLPKLPQFFQSAIQSIIMLIQTVLNMLDFDVISGIVENILNSILNGITSIASMFNQNTDKITLGFIKLVSTVIKNLSDWIKSGGWRELLNAIINIQKMIENIIIENIDDLVDTIVSMLPDLVEALKKSIVSASKTLGKLAPKILPLIAEIINAIIEVITSDEVLDSFFVALEGIIEGLVPAIITLMNKGIPKLIQFGTKIVTSPAVLTKTISAIITGFIKGFQKVNWADVVKAIFTGFIDAFKTLFGIHSPSTLFEGFGENIMQGLLNGLQSMFSNVCNFFSNLWTGIKNAFSNVGDWFKTTFDNAVTNIKNAFNGIGDWFESIWNNIKNGLQNTMKTVKEGFEKISEHVSGDGGETARRVGLGILTGGLSELPHIIGHANGSNAVPKGLSIVGEAGPELVNFRGGEQVLNNRNTNKALSEMGGKTNNFSVVFNNTKDTTAYAMMQQLRQYNRQLAINGVF